MRLGGLRRRRLLRRRLRGGVRSLRHAQRTRALLAGHVRRAARRPFAVFGHRPLRWRLRGRLPDRLHVPGEHDQLPGLELRGRHVDARRDLRRNGRMPDAVAPGLRRRPCLRRRRRRLPHRLPRRRRLLAAHALLPGLGVHGRATRGDQLHERRPVPGKPLRGRRLLRGGLLRSLHGLRRVRSPRHVLADFSATGPARAARRLLGLGHLRQLLRWQLGRLRLSRPRDRLRLQFAERDLQPGRAMRGARRALLVRPGARPSHAAPTRAFSCVGPSARAFARARWRAARRCGTA
jgi:hypothetical protein